MMVRSSKPSQKPRAHQLASDCVSGSVGIVAGWGSFPVEVAVRLRQAGKNVFIVALVGLADPRLEKLAHRTQWCGVLKIGQHIDFFQRHKIHQVAFAGKLFKDQILYHGLGWIKHFPDLTCMRLLGGSFVTKCRDARDDTLLGAVTNGFARKGIEVLPITSVAPGLLAEAGCLTKKRPSRSQLLDIDFGWSIAQHMGGLDIGQSITVRDQLVLGVEAIEGTDALLARTGIVCPRGGFTLIKVAKPQQDMRFDVPTIGLQTVERLVRAGGKAIAIESGRTIIVDREAAIAFANANGVCIYARQAGDT